MSASLYHHTFSHDTGPASALVERLHHRAFADAVRVAEEGELMAFE